jgi:hypothetical protein
MRIRALLTLPWLLLPAAPLTAQEPDKLDSLERRLEQAERMIDMLQVQVAEQQEGGVKTRSGIGLDLSGTLLFNGFYNDAPVNNPDIPLLVLPPSTDGFPDQSLSGTVRQTRIIVDATVPDVLGGEATAELDVDFYGGQQALGRTAPIPRIRRLVGKLRWTNTWVMFGQEAPLVSELNPSSLAAIGIPGFSASGNLWYWLPQVRLGGDVPVGPARIGLEGAVLAAAGSGAAGYFPPASAAERSGRPILQGRLLATWGDEGLTGGTASIGGHYGWFATDGDSLLVSKAATMGAQFFVTQYVEIRGEGFIGEGLGMLGGGGVGQDLGYTGSPLQTKGGWAQLNVLPTDMWEVGGGAGIDDPDDYEVGASGIQKNFVWEGHVIWRPSPLVFGFEFRRLETTWADAGVGKRTGNHYNLAAGFAF